MKIRHVSIRDESLQDALTHVSRCFGRAAQLHQGLNFKFVRNYEELFIHG